MLPLMDGSEGQVAVRKKCENIPEKGTFEEEMKTQHEWNLVSN